MRETEFCNHYRSMSDNETCKAGIHYAMFKGLPFDQRPCFERDGVAPGGCPLAVFPTAEEKTERDRLMEIRFENIGKARRAIVEHCGGPWKRGTPGAAGVIDCPACDGKETLRFTRSGYNGHVHAACMTEGCVAWME